MLCRGSVFMLGFLTALALMTGVAKSDDDLDFFCQTTLDNPSPTSKYAHPTKGCQYYVECVYSSYQPPVAKEGVCPEGKAFDAATTEDCRQLMLNPDGTIVATCLFDSGVELPDGVQLHSTTEPTVDRAFPGTPSFKSAEELAFFCTTHWQPPRTLYANPGDCHFYIRCAVKSFGDRQNDTVGYQENCPSGFYFDNRQAVCVEEGPVRCQKPTIDIALFCADNFNVTTDGKLKSFAHPYTCSSFIQCSTKYNATVKSCNAGEFYDETQSSCIKEGLIPCEIPVFDADDFCNSKQLIGDSVFQHPYDCHSFVNCTVEGDINPVVVGTVKTCDRGYFWKEGAQVCLKEGKVKHCTNFDFDATDFCEDNYDEIVDRFAIPYNCFDYIQCTTMFNNSVAEVIGNIQSCRNNTFFDDTQLRCVPAKNWTHNAQISGGGKQTVLLCEPAVPDATNFCEKHWVYSDQYLFKIENECHSYIECSKQTDDKSVVRIVGKMQRCPKGMFWDGTQEKCFEEGKLPCHPPKFDPTEYCRDNWRPPKDLYAHPYDCHSFVKCIRVERGDRVTTVGYLGECREGFYWDDNQLSCIFGFGVACRRPVVNATAICRDSWVYQSHNFYPNQFRCDSYIECRPVRSFGVTNTVGFYQECPDGTYWNTTQVRCVQEDAILACQSPEKFDEGEFCRSNWNPSKSSNLFTYALDCHHFIECVSIRNDVNTSVTYGFIRQCGDGYFWDQNRGVCATEGRTACQNVTLNATSICYDNDWYYDLDNNIFPHPTDCKSYVECSINVIDPDRNFYSRAGYFHQCGERQFFDAAQLRCVREGSVTCTFPEKFDANKFCWDNWNGDVNSVRVFPLDYDCHSYVQCDHDTDNNRVGIVRTCRRGRFWDNEKLTCANEGITPCRPWVINATSFCRRRWAPGKNVNTIFADSKNCHDYIECAEIIDDKTNASDVVGFVRYCDEGFYFADDQKRCIEESSALACTALTFDVVSFCEDNVANEPKDLPIPHAHPYDCHAYAMCRDDNKTASPQLVRCTKQTYWNDQEMNCTSEGPTACQSPKFNVTEFCLTSGVDITLPYPHPNTCHRYVTCVLRSFVIYETTTGFELPCDNGFFWDQQQMRCIKEGPLLCHYPLVNVDTFCRERLNQTITIFAHPYDCHFAINCTRVESGSNSAVNGSLVPAPIIPSETVEEIFVGDTTDIVVFVGKTNTFWDDSQKNWIEEGPRLCQAPDFDSAAFCSVKCNSTKNTRFSHPYQCHSYVECSGTMLDDGSIQSIGTVHQCPSGTFYDQEQVSCITEGALACRAPELNVTDYCLKNWKHTRNILFPHPYDCHSFVNCEEEIVASCFGKAFYDANQMRCIIDGPVACKPPALDAEEYCRNENWYYTGNRYSHPYDCHSYFECTSASTYLRKCDSGFFWSGSQSRCVEQGLVACEPPLLDVVAFCSNTWQGKGFSYYGNPYDCHSYIECGEKNQTAQLLQCADKTYYDKKQAKCVAEDSGVPCNIPVTFDVGDFCKVLTQNQISSRAKYAHPFDCHSYITCSSDGLSGNTTSCSPGEFWDPNVMECMTEGYATCKPSSLDAEYFNSLCDTKRYELDAQNSTLIAVPSNCHLALACYTASWTLTECAASEYFNKEILKCIKESSVPCTALNPEDVNGGGYRRSRRHSQHESSLWAELCLSQPPNADPLHRHPDGDCHRYIKCLYDEDEAIGVEEQCRSGTFFDQNQQSCVQENEFEQCKPHPCTEPAIAASGRFQVKGMPCSEFYYCGSSIVGCCGADQHRFNSSTGLCEEDDSCSGVDSCSLYSVSTESQKCHDTYGRIRIGTNRARKYTVGLTTIFCSIDSAFDVDSCSCIASPFVNYEEDTARLLAAKLPKMNKP